MRIYGTIGISYDIEVFVMKEFTHPLSAKAITKVNNTNCAAAVKSGALPVFATPMLLALMEEATCRAAEKLLDEEESTVGTKVCISHDKASGIGTVVTAYATLVEADGRRLCFDVLAKDSDGDVIGKGSIERFVIIKDKFMKRVNK